MRKLFFSLLLAASTMTMYAADGALTGKFAVNADGKQVVFSQGNLQYQASTGTLRFATNQYDYVGDDTNGNVFENEVKCSNKLIANDYAGWIDLLCWNSCADPAQTAASDPSATFVDWGTRLISNGGNVANLWFTLSRAEWDYMCEDRTDADKLIGQGCVEGVNGLIILPDVWTLPTSLAFTPKPSNYTTNVYTATEWKQMQDSGAVFLPAGGWRANTTVGQANQVGGYWQSNQTPSDLTHLFHKYFTSGSITGGCCGVNNAWNARLVRKVPQKGDTIRYEYAGNNLFYRITSKVEGKYEVVGANGGGAYPDYYPNPADKPKGNVIFPDSIEDFTGAKYAVVGIGNALTNCEEVTGLQVNNIIESLPSYGLGGTKITSFDTKNVKSIGYAVFSGLKLTSVHIGPALETFWAFSYMLDYATDITIDEANPNFKLEGTMLISKDGKTLAGMPLYIADALYRLPNSLELIKDNVVSKQKGTLIYPKVIPFETNNPSPASYNMMNCPVGVVIVPCHLREDFTTGDFGKNFSMADTVISQLVYEVKATAGPNGSVAIVDTTDCNQVTITATPNVGCNFVAWSTGSTNPTLVLNVVADTTVKAIFEKQTFTVTVVAENGTVTAKDMMEAPVDLSQPIEYGMKLYLTATPNEGYEFDSWTNYDPATGLTVTDNITVTATFKTKPTGFDQINQQSTIKNQKLMINGQLFILRDGKLFNAQGARVE